MARRALPSGIVLAALALASVASLARVLTREPDDGRTPRLAAAVNGGSMEEFLAGDDEKRVILRWVDAGAPNDGWDEVSAVLDARCVTCHFSDPRYFAQLALDQYPSAARAATVRPVLEEKISGGSMGDYLDSVDEQTAIIAWISRGAPEAEWQPIKSIFAARCVSCHNPEGVAGIPSLDVYRPAARLATPAERPRAPIAGYLLPGVALALALAAAAAVAAASARKPCHRAGRC